MFPFFMQPFASVAQANFDSWMRLSASFADSVRQLNDLNRQAMNSTLADTRERWSSGRIEHVATPPGGQLPGAAVSYASGLWSIFNATATNMLQAMTGVAARQDASAPRLLLSSEPQPQTPASGAGDIVDTNGETIKRKRE